MSGLSSFAGNYFDALIPKFYKILPMKETDDVTLPTYVDSLCVELSGADSVFDIIGHDAAFVTIASIASAIRDNPKMETSVVRREVFHAISICKQLKNKYGQG